MSAARTRSMGSRATMFDKLGYCRRCSPAVADGIPPPATGFPNTAEGIVMAKIMTRALLVVSFALSAAFASAKEDRPYTEGPVTQITFIKVKPGMFLAYMKWVATDRKQLMDESKKEGLIIDSKIYQSQAHNPSEADIVLSVTFANMAALDGLTDREDALEEKLVGSVQKATDASIGREKMREVLGSQLIRELVLK